MSSVNGQQCTVRITALTGNPRPESRTHGLARTLAAELAGALPGAATGEVDLAVLGPRLLDPADPDARAAVAEVLASDILVIASPTHKGTYSGLLKSFLDRFDTGLGLAVQQLADRELAAAGEGPHAHRGQPGAQRGRLRDRDRGRGQPQDTGGGVPAALAASAGLQLQTTHECWNADRANSTAAACGFGWPRASSQPSTASPRAPGGDSAACPNPSGAGWAYA